MAQLVVKEKQQRKVDEFKALIDMHRKFSDDGDCHRAKCHVRFSMRRKYPNHCSVHCYNLISLWSIADDAFREHQDAYKQFVYMKRQVRHYFRNRDDGERKWIVEMMDDERNRQKNKQNVSFVVENWVRVSRYNTNYKIVSFADVTNVIRDYF